MKTKARKKQIKKAVVKPTPKTAKKGTRQIIASKRIPSKNRPTTKEQTSDIQQKDAGQFPGYPHYPAGDDITRNSKRIDADIEDLSLSKTITPKTQKRTSAKLKRKTADELVDESLKNSSNDLTKEDYEALGPKDLSLDMGDDEELKHRRRPVDFAGKDMDVPGSEDDDDREAIGSEDEENNSYSLGGDNHEDLEENRS
jgi:hypothetical protein